jgi:hypothetical protein
MKPLDPSDLEILAIHYDENQSHCESGTFCGIVLRVRERRRKILYIYENGQTDTPWIEPKSRGGWIDRTHSAIVTVDEATELQRQDLLRRIPAERLFKMILRERGQEASDF